MMTQRCSNTRALGKNGGRASLAVVAPLVLLLLQLNLFAAPVVDAAPAAAAAAAAPAGAITAAATALSSAAARGLRHAGRRPLASRPFPYDAFDRRSRAGWAKGAKAGGEPDPIPGKLATADAPSLGPYTARMEDLVLPLGYPLETYPVETEDGFILRVYRIPYGAKNATKDKGGFPRPVVLLHHGVTLSSACFVVLDANSSTAFWLADAGFDVWMVNTRGNTYSRGHRTLNNVQRDYWSFSMDELALIDLPTQIDYILKKTGQPSLALIGHSQGCTLPTMLLAAKPEYADKIWLLLLMGAVTHATDIEAPYLRGQLKTMSPGFLIGAGIGVFVPNSVAPSTMLGCRTSRDRMDACSDLIEFMFYGWGHLSSGDDFVALAGTWPSTVSLRNLYHWGQLFHRGGGLYMYDYGNDCSKMVARGAGASGAAPAAGDWGESCNQAVYGQDTPPAYELGNIRVKAAVFEGEHDLMATPKDVAKLLKGWNANLVAHKTFKMTPHMDFIWARNPVFKKETIQVLWDNAPRRRR